MINPVHPFPQRLPIKKRYISQIYENSQTSLMIEQKQEPMAKAAVPEALPLIMPKAEPLVEPQEQSQELPQEQVPHSQSQTEQQVSKRTHQRRQPRHRNHSCYHSFNFNYPQLEPLDLSKKHKCRDCIKNFRAVDRFKAHKRRHDIKKSGRYTCDQCGKPFVQQSSLITHRRIHTGEKPYHCDVCNNSYGDLSTFTKHTRTHTGEKPYKCEYCDQRFSQSGNCLRHKRSVHADIFTWV